MQISYQRLITEHDRVDTALVRLLNHVASVTPDPVATMLALSYLADELRTHLAHEDAFLYPNLIGDDAHAFPRIAADFANRLLYAAAIRESVIPLRDPPARDAARYENAFPPDVGRKALTSHPFFTRGRSNRSPAPHRPHRWRR